MGAQVLRARRWFFSGMLVSSLSAGVVVGCGGSDDDAASHDAAGARGGATATGGSTAKGGTAGQGAQAGALGAGGSGAAGGSGGSATGGSATGGSATGGSATGGSGATAGLGGSTGGSGGTAGTAGSSGGGGGRVLSEACLSPCLRELFMKCRPQVSCLHEMLTSDDNSYVECEPDRGFRLEQKLTDPDSGHRTLLTTLDGAVCYAASYDPPVWTYHDANGTIVATVTLDATNGNTGTCPLLDGSSSTKSYVIDTKDARCAPLDCTPGTCD